MPPLFFSVGVAPPAPVARLSVAAQMHGSKCMVAMLRTIDILRNDGALHYRVSPDKHTMAAPTEIPPSTKEPRWKFQTAKVTLVISATQSAIVSHIIRRSIRSNSLLMFLNSRRLVA
jgi:hypothetical protein